MEARQHPSDSKRWGKKEEFLFLEFQTLREEIKETKSRMFLIMNFSLTVVPTATLVADKYQISFLYIAMPFIVMAVSMLYLSENQAMMRCGRYIKKHIEPEIGEVMGWEQWLSIEHPDDRRRSDRFLSYFFVSIFFVYYVASSSITVLHFIFNSPPPVFLSLGVLYTALGLLYLRFFWRNIEFCTNRKIHRGILRSLIRLFR